MTKRDVWVGLAGMIVGILLTLGYAGFFNWWDVRNCSESGGVWSDAEKKCIEPTGAAEPPGVG